jgi:lysophospholipase L1-like esterase
LSEDAVILAFGDSLTYGTGADYQHSYPSVLAKLTGYSVINSGVPGEQTIGGLQRLPADLSRHSPDLVILCLGGNDILRRQARSVIKSNLREMVRLVQDHSAQILLVGVPDFGLIPATATLYTELAEEMEIAAENQVVARLLRDPAVKSDAIHFNNLGYQQLAEAIHKKLTATGALQP